MTVLKDKPFIIFRFRDSDREGGTGVYNLIAEEIIEFLNKNYMKMLYS